MKKQNVRLLCVMTVLALLLCCIPAAAEKKATGESDGWISITIGDKESEFSRKDIKLAIYLIATGDYGEWSMLDEYTDIRVFTRNDGSASVDVSLNKIAKRIQERQIKPTQTGKSDKDGKVEFKNLAHGIYYTMMDGTAERLTISPMLIAVPNQKGSLKVRVVAKYEYETPTPSPSPTPKPTPTPYEPVTTPTIETAPPTATPVPTEPPESEQTPVPDYPPTLSPGPDETPVIIEDYDTALGLGNIQMHVGVCFD